MKQTSIAFNLNAEECHYDDGFYHMLAGKSGDRFVEHFSQVTPNTEGTKITPKWRSRWNLPQSFSKHDGNPVFSPELTGSWNTWVNGVSIIPIEDEGIYRMFFAGEKGEGIGIAEAHIDEPTKWKERAGNPVLEARTDNWEGNLINQPRVVKVTNDHWRMYYTGWGFEGPGSKWAMGLAESHDRGISWKRVTGSPIIERGPEDSYDGYGVCVPMVIKVEDLLYMWYTAGVANPKGHFNIHLCHATSRDGVSWKKHEANPVLSEDFSKIDADRVISRPHVIHHEGVFRMWFSHGTPDYCIAYAESLDGVHWEWASYNPVLTPSPTTNWDDKTVEYPTLHFHEGKWRLWFCGNGFGSVGFAEGVHLADCKVMLRSGPTREVHPSWSEWQPVSWGQAMDVSEYFQFKIELQSQHPDINVAISDIDVTSL